MPYIGHSPEVAQRRYESVDDISGSFNGSTTSFALQVGGVTPAPFPVASENVLISVGGVIQEPDGTGTNGFQLTGTNIVFSSAPAAGQSFFGVILAGADYVTAGHAFPDGDAAGPSITFSQDLDTGVFRAGSGAIGFSGNGSEHARIEGSGRLLVGNPSARTNVLDGDGGNTLTPQFQFETANSDTAKGLSVIFGRNNSNGAEIVLGKHRSASVGGTTIVSDGDQLGSLTFSGSDGTNFIPAATIEANVDATPGSSDMPGRLVFSTTADSASIPTERMRLDSSGNLLLNGGSDVRIELGTNGTAGTNDRNHVRGDGDNLKYNCNAGGGHFFEANGGERMRIHTNGNVGIGTNSPSGLLHIKGDTCQMHFTDDDDASSSRIYQSGATFAIDVDQANAKGSSVLAFRVDDIERAQIRSNGEQRHFGTNATSLNIANSASAGNSYEFFYCQHSSTGLANGTNSFRVSTNGNVTNTNNSYGAISDQNLKENIIDATSQWDDIKGLQFRKYNFRENTGHETHTQLGLIAQEAESVSPGLVQTTPVKEGETVLDADGNQLESIKSVNYSVLYMKAVKALQEAQTRIESLETQNTAQQTTIDDLLARVTALEAA